MKTLAEMKAIIDADYQRHRQKFKRIDRKNKIVLLGDSMLAYLPLNDFGLDDLVENCGIPGDTTIGVKNRLDDIYPLLPSRVILNVGSNDLVLTSLSIDETVENILFLRDTLESKGIPVSVLSMTPVLRNHPKSNMDYIQHRTQKMLIAINQRLSKILPESVFIDVFHPLLDASNQLNPSYTTDGIHLNHEGYTIYLYQLNLI